MWRLTVIAALALQVFVLSPLTDPTAPSCTPGQAAVGVCIIDPSTGQLVVGGSIVRPAPPPDADGGGRGGTGGGTAAPVPADRPNLSAPCQRWTDVPGLCFQHSITVPPPGASDDEPIAPLEPAAAARPIAITDLASFTPLVGELVVEPEGWGVVGTPTNFYATAETHTMEGELFGAPIEVRWTPSSYRFDYGDGTVEETSAAGAPWRGTEEAWTETTTSHTYATTDDVTASVTVIFTAEVSAGGGWFSVPGSLPVEAPPVGVKVFEVDTVLTDGDCLANPAAAGCG